MMETVWVNTVLLLPMLSTLLEASDLIELVKLDICDMA